MKYNQWLSLLAGCALLFGACSNDDDKYFDKQGIAFGTPVVVEMGTSSVQLQAEFTPKDDVVTGKRGFCYSTKVNPTVYDATAVAAVKNEVLFSCTLSGLLNNTTYYVRAFVSIYNGDISYSPQIEIQTGEGSLDDLLAQYKAPQYKDDYTGIAGWDQRANWNLANVHDPSVMRAEDGYFYMYQTDASYGNAHDGHGHFHARRSKDLVNWEYMGASMNDTPAWVKTKLNEYRATQGLPAIENPSYGFWAPVARKVATGKYRMYYSVIIDNFIKTGAAAADAGNFDNSWTERAFIGMMETTDPASNVWEDKGFVVCSSSDKGMNEWGRPSTGNWEGYFKWNAIDPTYVITQGGEHWLIYGSWHSGIAAIQVSAETGKPLNELGAPWDITDSSAYGKRIYKRGNSRWQASEGPEIIYNPETDYYYLFMAYDELAVAYNTRVARSKTVDGPYYGIDGANVTEGADMLPVVTHPYKFGNDYGWVGIAHCAVFDDGAGNWYYASQGRLPNDVPGINASNAVMMGHVRSIRWTSDGWPVVMPERYGAVPEVKIGEAEIVGDWEHIDLSYSYGKQKGASTMTFAADHTITSGPWKGGTWSFDAEKQILTANGVELCVQREADWEASPRKHTLVYAGYTTQKTYWGKKK